MKASAEAPDATETISCGIPTFGLHGKHLVHFAGWKRHVGFYPIPNGVESLENALEPYKSGKGSARFPLGEPLPRTRFVGSSIWGSKRLPAKCRIGIVGPATFRSKSGRATSCACRSFPTTYWRAGSG